MTAQNSNDARLSAVEANVAQILAILTGGTPAPVQEAQFSTPTVVAQATAPVSTKKVHALVTYVNQDGKTGECTEAQFAVRAASAARLGRTLTITGRHTGTIASAPRKERIATARPAQDTKPCAVQGCTKKTLTTLCRTHRAAQA